MKKLLTSRCQLAQRAFAHSVSSTSKLEYDYVVVGAGTAGCVLTQRLSAAKNDVCLLEVGPSEADEKVQMPYSYADLFYDKKYNWNFYSAPQENMNNRRIYIPRGRGLGGSANINGMVFMRPHPLDLNRWAFSENAYGWSFANLLPYFKRIESYQPSSCQPSSDLRKYRGFHGPLPVVSGKVRNDRYIQAEANDTFLEAGQQAGLPYTHDANGYQQEGVCWFDSSTDEGERMNTANTYLKLALQSNRKHVHVQTNLLATKLLVQQSRSGSETRVVGVETADANDPNKIHRFYARKDVIVSSGSYNSPQLLQLSGIGDADELKKVGVQPIVHLPGVGKNLQDHLKVSVTYESEPQKLHKLRNLKYDEEVREQWRRDRTGVAATNQMECGAHFCTNDLVEHPNAEIHYRSVVYQDVANVRLKLMDVPSLSMIINTQRERSRGFVKLHSANPSQHPLIDPRFLSDARDTQDIVDAVKFCRFIFQQKAFEPIRKREISPGVQFQSDVEIGNFVRNNAVTIYHPIGTCKMGDIKKDPLAVVDPLSLRVFGVDGLRVVDASVMPSELSGNINATIIVIAERASDLMLGNKLPEPENLPFCSRVRK